jgi:adenylate kinase family enzyme
MSNTFPSFPDLGRRIAVIGATGSGKTTLAQELALRLGYRCIELDALQWLPGWQEANEETLITQVEKLTAEPGWICDGNYRRLRKVIWSRADTLIWLDYSFALVLTRLLKRSFRRVFGKVELWNGNRENFRNVFLSRDSLILWLFKTHGRYRREFRLDFASPEYQHLRVLHFTQPRQTDEWLRTLK